MPSIILDSYYRKLFELLLFKSKILNYDDIILPGAIIDVPTYYGTSKLFDMLMLAKDIDFHKDLVSFEKLASYNIFPRNSLALSKVKQAGFNVDENDKIFIKKITYDVLVKNIDRMARYFSGLEKVYKSLISDNTKHYFKLIESIILYTVQLIYEGNDDWLRIHDLLIGKFGKRNTPIYHLIIWQVEDTYRDIYEGHLNSLLNGKFLITNYRIDNSFSKNESENVLKLVRIDFREKIKSLPKPRNIEEALDFRENISLLRLRNQIDYWIELFQNQEFNELAKIEEDIEKASIEMNKIKKFQRFKEYDLYAILTFSGSQIPVASNIISLLGVIDHFYVNEKIKNFGWIQ